MLEQNLKTQPLIFNNVVASLTKVGLLALSNKELGVGKELRMGANGVTRSKVGDFTCEASSSKMMGPTKYKQSSMGEILKKQRGKNKVCHQTISNSISDSNVKHCN